MVTIKIVINSTRVMGTRVTISCRYCIAFEVMLLFLVLFVCLSRSESGAPCVRGVHSSNKHCVAVYKPISTTSTAFFQKGLPFQMQYVALIFVGRSESEKWRSKIAKIKKIGGKVCAHHFVQLRDLKKIPCSSLGRECICAPI